MSKTKLTRYVVLQKARGETPLDVLTKWKAEHSEFQDVPMSYAGRLDPMAEGKLLVLLGDECKKQSAYTKLDKEYEIEVLLGLKTDTGDVLGFVAQEAARANEFLNSNETHSLWRLPATSKSARRRIQDALKHELGSHSRRYPVFSSKTVQGKPLFMYALEGLLSSIAIPEHIETIYSISQLGSYQLTALELQEKIKELLSVVPRSDEPSKELGADFRQDEVRAKWQEFFALHATSSAMNPGANSTAKFTVLRLRVTCGSGAYMRTLAERIGTSLGTTGLALSIKRTRIGKYVQLGSIGFWTREYR